VPTVLFCSQSYVLAGGIPTWLDQLCERLPALGWRPIVALARGARFHDPAKYQRAHPSLDYVVMDGRSGTAEGRINAVMRAIRSTDCDVLVPLCVADAYEAIARSKRRGAGTRLLGAVHGAAPRMLVDLARYLQFCDGAVAVSRLTTHLLREGVGLDPERIFHVPNGAVAPRRPRSPRAADAPLRLGYVGRLDPDKRVLDLVALCTELDRRGFTYELTVVGGGSDEEALRARLSGHARSATVRFLGTLGIEQIYDGVYPQLDCVLLFSEIEGLPLTLLEAMAHGVVPVVSRFHGYASEGLLRDGETALLFAVGDTAAAAACIVACGRDVELFDRLSSAGKFEVSMGYSLERSARGWADAMTVTLERTIVRGESLPLHRVPAGRLDRWLPGSIAETGRRLLRRQFRHSDPDEWPYAGPVDANAESRLSAIANDFEQTQARV